MAFANLFTRLSAVEEDVKSPGSPASTHRKETENYKRGNARKRKTQFEQTGPYNKKRCYRDQTTITYNVTSDDFKGAPFYMHNTDSERGSFGFTKEGIHSYKDQAGRNNMRHKGQNYKTKNNCKVNKHQEQRNKTEGQKSHHQQKGRGRPATRGGSHRTRHNLRRGGGDWKNKNNAQDSLVKRPRSMTEEFKEQNVLLVDGRFLCRHFLWGRCIKGDDCQLEHVQGYNDLIKEACKFYIQGFCTKGGTCPYMHKSFPCKFFHKRGKCSQGADCRFSHEPLDDVTNQLLDEALKRENDLFELSKKAEQKSSGRPVNTDEYEIKEENRSSDILKQPIRPNFYKSMDTNAENDHLLRQTEEQADNVEEAVPLHAPDAVQSHSPPSATLRHEEPVCYSVEAVLGPQLYKPLTGYFTTPGSQKFAPLPSDCTSDSANQSQVPYSVDAVLSTCKSVENSTFGDTPSPSTPQTVTYTPKMSFAEVTDPSETPDKKHSYSVNIKNEVNKSQERMFKNLSSLHTGLISKACLNDTLTSGDHKKQGLNNDIICSVNCKGDGILPFRPTNHKSIFSKPPGLTSSKHPEQLNPHRSGLTSDTQASFKPFCPSSGFTKFKSRAAVPAELVTRPVKSSDSANSVSHHFAAKQPTEIHLHSKIAQSGIRPGTERQYSTETTAECSSRKAHCGGLAVGCKKIQKRLFHSLFASPIADTLQPVDDSVTNSSCAEGLSQSPSPAPQAADCRSNHLKTALEPYEASTRSFLSLFAAPLNAAPLPCRQSPSDYSRTYSHSQQSVQLVDNTSHLSDSKRAASNLETLLPHRVTTDVKETSHAPRFHDFSPNPKMETDSSTVPINQPRKQLVNPDISLLSDSLCEKSISSTPCGESQSTSPAHQQLLNISSHKGSAEGDAENSVLKTLFLCLSPYQQDGEQQDSPGFRPLNSSSPSSSVETDCHKLTVLSDIRQQQESIQISVPSENEKMDKRGTGGVFVKKQQKRKTKSRQNKKLEIPDTLKQSTEERVAHSRNHQPSLQTPQVSLDATGASTLSSLKMMEPQVRDSDTHNVPCNPEVLLMSTSEEGKWVNGNAATTPLKDLFKTLDTAVFHFGH